MESVTPFAQAIENKVSDSYHYTLSEPGVYSFPDCVFPGRFVEVVNSIITEKQNIPANYIKASIFSAMHSAIGASLRAEEGDEKPILWTVLVGHSGDAKTHALRIAFKPFDVIRKRFKDEYKEAMRNHVEGSGPIPFLKQPIHNKATIEALNDEQVENPKGATVVSDELKSWIDNFGRSNRGNDEGFFLDSWNGTPFTEATRHGKKTFCENPYLSIVGGTQPGVLEEVLSKSKQINGFFQRCLFVVNGAPRKPRKPQRPQWDAVADEYSELMIGLFDHEWEIDRVPLSAEAKAFWEAWCVANNDRINELRAEGNNLLASVLSKWEIYLIRWSLTIQGVKSYVFNQPLTEIDLASIQSAVRVHEFFFANSEAVQGMIETPALMRDMVGWQKELLSVLGEKFQRKTALDELRKIDPKATDNQVRGRIDRFLKRADLFHRNANGEYVKMV